MLYILLDEPSSEYYIEKMLQEHKSKSFPKIKQQIISQCNNNTDQLVYLSNCLTYKDIQNGQQLVHFLYNKGYRYTGTYPWQYDPTRQEMKMNALSQNIRVPLFCIVYSLDNLEEKVSQANLKYPMFVKAEQSFNSEHISPKSKVNNYDELITQTKIIIENYGGALIEEFIDGREFSILTYGNESEQFATDPVEYRFKDSISFLTYQQKHDYSTNYWYEKVNEEEIIKSCKELAIKYLKEMDSRGYFRLDIRMTKDKCFYFLEINPYPSMFCKDGSTADTIFKVQNIQPYDFLNLMIKYSIKNIDTTEPRLIDLKKKFGIFATKSYQVDEVIADNNKANFRLIHLSQDKDIYSEYGYKLNQGHIIIWSRDFEDWRPINHSCDPNSKYVNLQLLALKPIKSDDEITIDYNTFCVNFHFDCYCGSPNCSKKVTCNNYLSYQYKNQHADQDITPYIKMLQNYHQLIKIANFQNPRVQLHYDCKYDWFYIIAGDDIKKGETVVNLNQLKIIPLNNKYAITKNLSEYYDTETNVLQFTNHSCSPNMKLSEDLKDFIAVYDVKKGEQLTFNYNQTEYNVIRPFDCKCGSKECYGRVSGFKNMTAEMQKKIESQLGKCCTYVPH